MPETEQLELRTDTVEQIIERLDYDIVGRNDKMPRSRREAVKARLRKQTKKPDAIGLCGLPGAGKSRTSEKLADVYDTRVVSMGDAIRENAPDEVRGQSEDLGAFAAATREEDATIIPSWVIDETTQYDNELFIIDGVRSPTDYSVLKDYFEEFYLLEVEAEFYHRLERLQERGREGEDQFTAVDLAERDEREHDDLGLRRLIEAGHIDVSMKNGTGPDQLPITLSSVVENNLPFDIANGKPLGLDDGLEKQRKVMAGGGPVGGPGSV